MRYAEGMSGSVELCDLITDYKPATSLCMYRKLYALTGSYYTSSVFALKLDLGQTWT